MTAQEDKLKNSPKIGSQAPSFAAMITEKKSIASEQLLGKYIVIYFYPKDNTPGCTVEANDFNALKNEFIANNAVILGVSKDNLASHEKFKNKYSLQFDLLADIDSKICADYGVWVQKSMFGKKYMGIQRATFLIDPEGKIAHIWPEVSVKNHAAEVLAKLKELSC